MSPPGRRMMGIGISTRNQIIRLNSLLCEPCVVLMVRPSLRSREDRAFACWAALRVGRRTTKRWEGEQAPVATEQISPMGQPPAGSARITITSAPVGTIFFVGLRENPCHQHFIA